MIFEIFKWITPIILFFLGYLVNELIRWRNRIKELKLLRSFLLTQLQQLYQNVKDQIDLNVICIKRLKDFDKKDLRLGRISGNQINRIKQIPFKDIFVILVQKPLKKKKKGKDYLLERFNKLHKILDYYDTAISSLYSNNDNIIKNLNNILEKWNQSHSQTTNYKNTLVSINKSTGIDYGMDKFVTGYNDIIFEFGEKYGNNVQNIEIGYQELVLPLFEHSKKFSNDKRAAYLMQILQVSRRAYLETKSQHNLSRQGLIETTRHLIKFNIEFKNIIEEIENEA